jgi:cephalosporin-C deacetylase
MNDPRLALNYSGRSPALSLRGTKPSLPATAWQHSLAILTLGVALVAVSVCTAQEIIVTPVNASGVYALGEKIQWRVEVNGGQTNPVTELRYVLKQGGLTVVREGKLPLTNGSALLEASLDEPGTMLAELTADLPGKKLRALAGAAVAPDKIRPSAPPPDDFGAFWTAKLAGLKAVPANPLLEPGESGKPGVDYFKVQMDNIRGTHIYGQLARPTREGKFPAMLIVQWAGVYGLPKWNVVGQAEKGWLALNIMAHDLPFDKPEDFYRQASQTTLKDYVALGNDDREQSYFLRMYLSCYRAADYLAQRPDWDGRTLVVTGTSQGGLQAIMTAAIHPKVTALLANVPAGCDRTGPWVGRAAGWPGWYAWATNSQKITATSRYYDVMNFAPRVTCPALVAVGLIDTTCPPAGVFATCNQFQGPKEVIVMVTSGHQDVEGSQARYYARAEAWNKALLKGEAVPPGSGGKP